VRAPTDLVRPQLRLPPGSVGTGTAPFLALPWFTDSIATPQLYELVSNLVPHFSRTLIHASQLTAFLASVCPLPPRVAGGRPDYYSVVARRLAVLCVFK